MTGNISHVRETTVPINIKSNIFSYEVEQILHKRVFPGGETIILEGINKVKSEMDQYSDFDMEKWEGKAYWHQVEFISNDYEKTHRCHFWAVSATSSALEGPIVISIHQYYGTFNAQLYDRDAVSTELSYNHRVLYPLTC